jgi:hypothetical protein
MRRLVGAGMLLAAAMTIGGCNAMKIEDFAGTQPVLEPEKYFLGETRGWGMFHDRFGNLRRQFVVDMTGEMEGGVLVLKEDFVYDDGAREQRIWRLKPLGDGRYEGVAGDVVGTASGQAAGNALNWRYDLDLKVGDGTWRVAFDDWMFLQPGGVVLNRASVTRWGFEIGTLTVSFAKKPAAQAAGSSDAQTQISAQAAE